MVGNKGWATGPELRIRRLLHRAGLRYRMGRRPEPTLRMTADVVFTRARIAVFVDGCFWHSCPVHGHLPREHAEYWRAKLANNRRRDEETNRVLTDRGWMVVRVGEHEDPVSAAVQIRDLVRGRR